MIVRLEYSPSQRQFHFAEQSDPRSLRWAERGDTHISDAIYFVSFMERKYVNGRSSGILPEHAVVALEYALFNELKDTRRKLAGRGGSNQQYLRP